MAATKEAIVQLLKQKGPLVPNDIKKALGGDTMILGAMLSELASRKFVQITDVKKGGSPFYYVPEHSHRLMDLVEYLNSKDQNTVQLLRKQQVVADKSMELLERVSVRKIKDYAKELKVNTAQGLVLFWRFYTVSETEAIEILKDRYNPKPKVEEPIVVEQPKVEAPVVVKEEPKVEPVAEIPKEEPKPVSKPAVQKTLAPVITELESSPFLEELLRFFAKREVKVLTQEQLGKNREYAFEVVVPSAVGNLQMYVVARNKKKLNQQDVAPALLQAKMKNLPCMFVYNGEFSKKSLELIEKEYFGLILVELE